KGMSGNYHIIQYNGRNAIIHIGNTVVSNGEPIKNEFAQSYNGSYQIKISRNAEVFDNTSGKFVKFAEVNQGEVYNILSNGTQWVKIGLANRIGYINKKNIDFIFTSKDSYFTVVSNDATLYDISTGKYNKVGVLSEQQVFKHNGRSGNYHRITLG